MAPREGQPESRRLTELPQPAEGITGEVFFELLKNRAKFVDEALANFQKENPALYTAISRGCIISPDRERSLDWALTYYEIFLRSARKKGEIILSVSRDKVKSTYAEALREAAMVKDNPDAMEIYVKNRFARIYETTKGYVERSPELGEFWMALQMYQLTQTASGRHPFELYYILRPLYDLHELFHSQQETNRLRKSFGQ